MKNVAAFSKPYEAHLLISRLEGSGIPAFARDENMVTLDWLASNAIGGVKVDVADEDYERALAVIAASATIEEKASAVSAPSRVSELERGFKRAIVGFLLGSIPAGFLCFWLLPAPKSDQPLQFYEAPPPDVRPLVASLAAMAGGIVVCTFQNRRKPERTAPNDSSPRG